MAFAHPPEVGVLQREGSPEGGRMWPVAGSSGTAMRYPRSEGASPRVEAKRTSPAGEVRTSTTYRGSAIRNWMARGGAYRLPSRGYSPLRGGGY